MYYHYRIFYIILSVDCRIFFTFIIILKYYTEYLYSNAYRLEGLADPSWPKWLLWLPKTLRNRSCWPGLIT